MSNLLPFDQHKNKFSSRFKQSVPEHLPTSEEHDAFGEDDMDYDTSTVESFNDHDNSDENVSNASVALRSAEDKQLMSQYLRGEHATSRDDFFADYYRETSSNAGSYFAPNYGDEEDSLPPPPPEDELQVNFSFNDFPSSIQQEDLEPSVDHSPLLPKLNVPLHKKFTKAPPPPPPPTKSVKTKPPPLKPNELRQDKSRVDIVPERNSTGCSTYLLPPCTTISASKSSSNIDRSNNEEKKYKVDNSAKANWGSIATMIANKPHLKPSNENRSVR